MAVFDGTGRGMYAGLGTAVALAATRAARRAGSKVDAMAAAADTELAAQFSDCRFASAILAQLDLGTGILSYINAGHPEPVLLRGTNAVRTLSEERRLRSLTGAAAASIAQEALEPGDRVLLYTDGVIEARSPDGELFGRDRLVDLATRTPSTTCQHPKQPGASLKPSSATSAARPPATPHHGMVTWSRRQNAALDTIAADWPDAGNRRQDRGLLAGSSAGHRE